MYLSMTPLKYVHLCFLLNAYVHKIYFRGVMEKCISEESWKKYIAEESWKKYILEICSSMLPPGCVRP